ncbi:MAG TPA: ThiF family adenylyltransferase [Candidatus Dormibacteraeota bacterium]|nr:ThiF family adenylyltransferase [Candidatus Dormibacteraeota bacterium]
MDKPIILVEGQYTQIELQKLKNQKIWKSKDIYKSQLKELFEILNAHLIGTPEVRNKLDSFILERSNPNPELRGNYVYYPWSGLLLHTVSEKEQNMLRTNRTSNLLTKKEQEKLGQFNAGVAGLSFGNGIAVSLVYSGAANNIKLADNDIFETTNLNRVRVGLSSVDEPKTTVTAQDIYEINPYANIKIFTDGLTDENVDSFIQENPKLNVVFDVVDNFAMKVRIRLGARKAGVPVVMLTSLEDSILVDIERFDLDPSAEIFHGLLGDVTEELLTKEMTEQDKAKYAMTIVGPQRVSYRNLLSLSEIGKTLVSRPHLYGTVSIVCGLAAYIVKRIALNEDMPSMRSHILFSDVLGVLPNKDDTLKARQILLSQLIKDPKSREN